MSVAGTGAPLPDRTAEATGTGALAVPMRLMGGAIDGRLTAVAVPVAASVPLAGWAVARDTSGDGGASGSVLAAITGSEGSIFPSTGFLLSTSGSCDTACRWAED